MLDIASLNNLNTIRISANGVLDTEKLTAKRIIDVRVNTTPARLIAYKYYGDSTIGENIAKLNKEINVSYVEGEIEVFTV